MASTSDSRRSGGSARRAARGLAGWLVGRRPGPPADGAPGAPRGAGEGRGAGAALPGSGGVPGMTDAEGGPDLDVQPDLDGRQAGPGAAAPADEVAGGNGDSEAESGLDPGGEAALGPEAADLEEQALDTLLGEGEGGDAASLEPSLPGGWAGAPPSGVAEAPAGPGGGVGEDGEAATKLDLARAYLELGDEAGARELLEEVQEEGAGPQRERARHILGELGGE